MLIGFFISNEGLKKPQLKKLRLKVRAGRLELPHLAALDPKSSVSTNSTTPAGKSH